MAFTENFSVFFGSSAEFSVAATYNAGTIYGILDHAYVEAGNVAGERPIFLCATADVASAAYGDSIVIDGTTYTIIEPRADGTGMTMLVLDES